MFGFTVKRLDRSVIFEIFFALQMFLLTDCDLKVLNNNR